MPDRDGRLIDFSPRRDHGVDAAMKAARSAAIAGAGGTSNVAAAMRYGLSAVGTMAHSYVMSFEHEQEAFRAFMEDVPGNAVMLVDTYDTLAGVRRAIAAARRSPACALAGRANRLGRPAVHLARGTRLLDEAGITDAVIVASGDLDERGSRGWWPAGAPIDRWGVGTDLGTSRDSPAVGGVYKLVADMLGDEGWRGTSKLSPDKATVPGPKQVWRRYEAGQMAGDVIARRRARRTGEPLLVPAMRAGAARERRVAGADARARGRATQALPPGLLRRRSRTWRRIPIRSGYSAKLLAGRAA